MELGVSDIDDFKDYGSLEFREECKKILAFPEDFTDDQLNDIILGKLKDEGEIFIECEKNTDQHPDWVPSYNNPDDPPTISWFTLKQPLSLHFKCTCEEGHPHNNHGNTEEPEEKGREWDEFIEQNKTDLQGVNINGTITMCMPLHLLEKNYHPPKKKHDKS